MRLEKHLRKIQVQLSHFCHNCDIIYSMMDKNLILLVEDEAPIRAMIRFALHRDFEIKEAADVNQARRAIKSKIPDLAQSRQ